MRRWMLLAGLLAACGTTPTPVPGPPPPLKATYPSRDNRTATALVGEVSVPLMAGWNAVALQGVKVTTLAGTGSVAGMAWFDGSGYVTQSVSPENLDGRRGMWMYASSATSFTYSADPGDSTLPLRPGWNLVSFAHREPLRGAVLQTRQNGAPVPLLTVLLPTFQQINADGTYTPVELTRAGVMQPGRPYWIYANAAVTLSWGSTPEPSPAQAGYQLETYASVPAARHLALGPDGTIFVGTNKDAVYAVPSQNRVVQLLRGLNGPNGVCVDGDDLLVGEIDAVRRYRGLAKNLVTTGAPELVCKLTPDVNHGMRVIRRGPDGALYIGSGYPNNIGVPTDPYGTILRLLPGKTQPEVYVRGIRNSMGFDWHPGTDQLWFSDNGRDWLGDDIPPEEVNRVERAGEHFGFPYRHGKDIVDPDVAAPPGFVFTPPAVELQAHVAPLGLRFYRGSMLPDRGRMFVCTHGSWNRSSPVGYEVLSIDPDTGARRVLVGGWLQADGRPTHRPVDVQELADGSLIISDDFGGTLFRLSYVTTR